jgi:hypothetical protein
MPISNRMLCAITAYFLRPGRREEIMAKDNANQGGPTHKSKDEPTADRSHHNAPSRDELKERSVHGARPGKGARNGSSKHR